MTTLDDLKPRIVTVTIELPHGEPFVVALRTLGYHEWNMIGSEIPDPAIPRTRVGDDGKPALNPNDPDYLRARGEVTEERTYRRLASALIGGGMELPGDDIGAQARYLRENIDAGIANVLIDFLVSTVAGGRARIETRADTFHGGRPAADASAAGARVDTGNVGRAAGRRKG